MSFYLKKLILNLAVLCIIWFSMTQINSFAGWKAIYFPVFWIFVFFPAMTVNWEIGIILAFLGGLFFESQFMNLQGFFIPTFIALYLFLYDRRSRIFDIKFSHILGLASLSHAIIALITGISTPKVSIKTYMIQSIQDWACGQLLLFILLPILWIVFSTINTSPKSYGVTTETSL